MSKTEEEIRTPSPTPSDARPNSSGPGAISDRVRSVKSVSLEYGTEITAELPSPLKILGLFAQKHNADDEPSRKGVQRKRIVRDVKPRLVYLDDPSKAKKRMTFLLLRNFADVPAGYDHVGSTEDRNPRTNGFATCWIRISRDPEQSSSNSAGGE